MSQYPSEGGIERKDYTPEEWKKKAQDTQSHQIYLRTSEIEVKLEYMQKCIDGHNKTLREDLFSHLDRIQDDIKKIKPGEGNQSNQSGSNPDLSEVLKILKRMQNELIGEAGP